MLACMIESDQRLEVVGCFTGSLRPNHNPRLTKYRCEHQTERKTSTEHYGVDVGILLPSKNFERVRCFSVRT